MDLESSTPPPLMGSAPSVTTLPSVSTQMPTTVRWPLSSVSTQMPTTDKFGVAIVEVPRQNEFFEASIQSNFPIKNLPDQKFPLWQSPSPASVPVITPTITPAAANFSNVLWAKTIADDFHRYGTADPEQRLRECSIYVVPPDISRFDSDAYKPKAVSIGPYHFKYPVSLADTVNHPYKDMQLFKWRCIRSFTLQWCQDHPDVQIDELDLLNRCILKMMGHEARIRSYYPRDTIGVTSEELATIMVLDGCFILQLLLDHDHHLISTNQVAGRVWTWTLVQYDLLLLENQIPFFLLDELVDFFGIGNVDLVQCALNLFRDTRPRHAESFSPPHKDQILHLLHLFYTSLLPIHPSNAPPATEIWIPCATELTDVGIKFDKKTKAKSFLDVNFTRKGMMEIPPLLIDDHTGNLFRNLIAFEQCYPYTGCHISVYASFMDCIINSEQDVRLLHLNGILVNRMSADQDITHFFSNICKGAHVARDRFYLAKLFVDVTGYKDDPINKCLVGFKRSYFSNRWAVFAAAVSVVFFILTIVQTFFTVFPYYNPRG